jgi:hypothetical protein
VQRYPSCHWSAIASHFLTVIGRSLLQLIAIISHGVLHLHSVVVVITIVQPSVGVAHDKRYRTLTLSKDYVCYFHRYE